MMRSQTVLGRALGWVRRGLGCLAVLGLIVPVAAGAIADALDMTAEQRADHERIRTIHFARIVKQGKVYSQPFSEGGAAADTGRSGKVVPAE